MKTNSEFQALVLKHNQEIPEHVLTKTRFLCAAADAMGLSVMEFAMQCDLISSAFKTEVTWKLGPRLADEEEGE